MNNRKITFIICSNDDLYLSECLKYLEALIVPEGFEADVQVIHEAKSMLLGMEEGRNATDAKYKVFMHQDVFIINPYFIQNVIDIFSSDSSIGLIGMVGSEKMPIDAVMWHGDRVGSIWNLGAKKIDCELEFDTELTPVRDVVAVDGLMIITAYDDVKLRTEILSGWDFYDVSTSFEYKRAGYRVVVPDNRKPWCIHDDGVVLNLWNYDKYRHIVLKEYKEFFLWLRQATEKDCELVYEFANDPVVRANSFSTDAIKYDDHLNWYQAKINSDDSKIYILSSEQEALGQVRIDKVGRSRYKISYMISSGNRGKGYAKKMLQLLEEKVQSGAVFEAEVKKDNIASQKVFKSLGYKEEEQESMFVYIKTI